MAKTKSPPGHQETTLETLQAELVVVRQRHTGLKSRLEFAEKKTADNATCTTTTVILAVIAFLLALGHIVCDFVRALS